EGTERARQPRSLCTAQLEVELAADLEEAAVDDALRRSPCRKRAVLLDDGAHVEQVVDVEVARQAPAAKTDRLRQPPVELIGALSVHRARRDEIHDHVRCAARERTSEGWLNLRAQGGVVRRNLRTGHA